MSADTNEKIESNVPPPPENRSQRWVKYGSNVVLTVIVGIVLAGLLTYIAQANDWRIDTTAEGINSLRPQTRNVLRDLTSDIKLVSLYTRTQQGRSTDSGARPIDKARFVSDLLDNYRRASSHITTEVIDPVAEKGKVDELMADIDRRYGKDIANYKSFLDDYVNKIHKELTSLVAAESEKVGSLNNIQMPNDRRGQNLQSALDTIRTDLPHALENNKARVDRRLKEHRPDYKGISDSIRELLDSISQSEGKMIEFFQQYKNDNELPAALRMYMNDSIPRHQQIKKIADDQVARIGKLGELKVDELQRALNVPDPILVLGPTDWRILSETQVWPENKSVKTFSEGKVTPSFAGEQQITTAILGLTQTKKPKVVFIRPGGAPLTPAGFPPFQPSGPFSEFAERLRAYNFDVLEKDLSGQWAMRAQMQQMPSPPEPSWEELKDAVWIVIDVGGAPPGPESLSAKLAEHLGHGGSAVILAGSGADTLDAALKDWGVELRTDLMVVHEQVPPTNATGNDMLQQALRQAVFFDFKDYGNAELARPLKNLESIMVQVIPVRSHSVAGYKVTPLIPVPDAPAAPKSWGEKDTSALIQESTPPTFDESKGDVPGPLYVGATSEKEKGGGRLVALGSVYFALDQFLDLPDPQIARDEGRFVARFPGNGELAANSVFWAAKMDSMIALSPNALQVSRIGNMSKGAQNFWRVGLLLVILPLCVIAGGLSVYYARRD